MAAAMTSSGTRDAFLRSLEWNPAAVEPLAGDASFRRYFRVREAGRTAILMDAPPPNEDVRPFLHVADYLEAHRLRAPRVLGRDVEAGLILLEDLGDDRMREAADADPRRAEELYGAAVDLLLRLRAVPAAAVPDYSTEVLHREAALLTEWYLPSLGVDADGGRYREVWTAAFAQLATSSRITVLRDYHAENIMLLDGGQELALLDFQDALIGHPAYDLVSLLQDARRDVDPAVERRMLDRYMLASGDDETFERDYAILGAQRNAKIIGIFTRLAKRDGKSRYLSLIPRVWRYLERDLEHPALADVRAWFDTALPPQARRQSPA